MALSMDKLPFLFVDIFKHQDRLQLNLHRVGPTPQRGIISPVIANWRLDGLEDVVYALRYVLDDDELMIWGVVSHSLPQIKKRDAQSGCRANAQS